MRIFILEDDCGTKAEYGEAQWFTDAEKVKAFAGEKIDAVFCGSDYDENSFWNVCYPDAELVIFPRDGISSTEIRKDTLYSGRSGFSALKASPRWCI